MPRGCPGAPLRRSTVCPTCGDLLYVVGYTDGCCPASPSCSGAGSIHMICQPWPSKSKEVREYMKPRSSAYSASACVVGSATSSLENCRKPLSAKQHDEGLLTDRHASCGPVRHARVDDESEPCEECLAALDLGDGDRHEQRASSVRGSLQGGSPVSGPKGVRPVDQFWRRNSPADRLTRPGPAHLPECRAVIAEPHECVGRPE